MHVKWGRSGWKVTTSGVFCSLSFSHGVNSSFHVFLQGKERKGGCGRHLLFQFPHYIVQFNRIPDERMAITWQDFFIVIPPGGTPGAKQYVNLSRTYILLLLSSHIQCISTYCMM